MSGIAVSRHAAVEPETIMRRIRRFFRQHGNSDGDVAGLPLTLEIGGYRLERRIIVNIQPRIGGSATEPRYGIFWSDEAAGPVPAFCGELVVSANAYHDGVELLLQGTYTKMIAGPIGAAFDAVLGQSIAEHAAEQFLRTMCAALETMSLDPARAVPAYAG